MKQTATLEQHIRFARRLVDVMDLRFNLFGIRFGVDPLLDVIPGLGNIVAACISFYLFWIARKLYVPAQIYYRMLWNIVIDYILGVVPFLGIFFDAFFRSNVKNFTLIEKYFDPNIIEGEVVNG